MSKVKTSVWSEQKYFEEADFGLPAKFFIQNALGDFVFFHCRSRVAAQAAVDEEYGAGKYTVRTSRLDSPKGDPNVRGSNTRKCFDNRLKGLK